jgi:hypothetical protein
MNLVRSGQSGQRTGPEVPLPSPRPLPRFLKEIPAELLEQRKRGRLQHLASREESRELRTNFFAEMKAKPATGRGAFRAAAGAFASPGIGHVYTGSS